MLFMVEIDQLYMVTSIYSVLHGMYNFGLDIFYNKNGYFYEIYTVINHKTFN